MANLSAPLDYTDKDFDSIRVRLFNLIGSVFPTWTEQEKANFGNILVELFSFVGDVLGKYQDNQAGESRWSQATQRKNLINAAKLLGFTASGATASQADELFSIRGGAVANDVIIPAGSIVRTPQVQESVRFQLLSALTILAGSSSGTGTVENSEGQQETFSSSGLPDMTVGLGSTPYVDNSAVISDGGGAYTQVDNFLDSGPADRHFTVSVDQNDVATIRFGNDISGVIPTGTITVDYKTGGGSAGVVESSAISRIEGFFTDILGNTVIIDVTNPAASTPAVDRQSTAQLRIAAPQSVRVLNRTVAREDYELNALALAEVGRALMLTSNQEVAVAENAGILFIIPIGGGEATASLLTDVETQVTVTLPNTLTFSLQVLAALRKTVDVSVKVWLSPGSTAATVKAAVTASLTAHFATELADGTPNPGMGFGFDFIETEGDSVGHLPWSDIHDEIFDTAGVRKIDDDAEGLLLNGVRADVSLSFREFPKLGTVTVINAATGTAI